MKNLKAIFRNKYVMYVCIFLTIFLTCLISSVIGYPYTTIQYYIIVIPVIVAIAYFQTEVDEYKKDELKCKHINKTLTFTYPPEDYNIYTCNDCGETDIFESTY